MDDDNLVARVAAGDDTALRELFGRHAPWLAVRLRAVLPAADVEDVLQETFLAAWRGAARLPAAGRLRRLAVGDRPASGRAAAPPPGHPRNGRGLRCPPICGRRRTGPTRPRSRWPGPISRSRSRPWARTGARNVRCGG